MACEYCFEIDGHHPRCPDYAPPKAAYYCSYCGEGIFEGEEYVKNLDGEYRHFDCMNGTRELLEWLGYEINTMERGIKT